MVHVHRSLKAPAEKKYNTTIPSGIAAPASTFNTRRSRQLRKQPEKTKTAVPVNSNPGCQQRQDNIEHAPAQNGLSFAMNSKDNNPNRIIGSFGCVPAIIVARCSGKRVIKNAMTAARRLSKNA